MAIKKKLLNKTTKTIKLQSIGLRIEPEESIDVSAYSSASLKNIFSVENIVDLDIETEGTIFSVENFINTIPVTKKGNDIVYWKNLQTQTLSPAKEVILTQLFEETIWQNTPLLSVTPNLQYMPIIVDDSFGSAQHSLVENIQNEQHGYMLTMTPSEVVVLDDFEYFYNFSSTNSRGFFALNENKDFVITGSSSVEINIKTKNSNQSYNLRKSFPTGYNFTPFSYLEIWIYGSDNVSLTVSAKNLSKTTKWLNKWQLKKGWQKVSIDISDYVRFDIKNINFYFYKNSKTDETVFVDSLTLSENKQIQYASSGVLETQTKNSKFAIKEIFFNLVHACFTQSIDCTVKCSVSLDDGYNWYHIPHEQYNSWINLEQEIWEIKNKIKIRMELEGDSTFSPVVQGYYLIYRM